MVLPQRLPQEVPGGLVELEKVGDSIELFLGHLEGIEPFGRHEKTPCEIVMILIGPLQRRNP